MNKERERETKNGREREQITDTTKGVFCLAASHAGWFRFADFAWDNLSPTAPSCGRTDTAHRGISQRSNLFLSPLCSQLQRRQQKQIRFGKDAYTQYTGGDNAMNVNYIAVIWRYDSI